jgi:hypothetical protein
MAACVHQVVADVIGAAVAVAPARRGIRLVTPPVSHRRRS